MKRIVFCRCRTTTTQKKLPSVEEVKRRMREIQHAVVTGGYVPVNILNADETGTCFGDGPTHRLVPEDADRSCRSDADKKS